MSASISEAPAPRRPRTEPILELLRSGDFEDVSRSTRGALRVLRCNRDGLSLYVRTQNGNERELHRTLTRYRLAYEGELDGAQQVEFVILNTDDSQAIWQLLDLLNEHAQRVRSLIEGETAARLDGAADVENIAGFYDPETREALTDAIARITSQPVNDDAYQGFVNAVLSHVDDWLSRRR